MTCRKHNYLVEFISFLETLVSKWPDIDSSIHHLTRGKLNCYLFVEGKSLDIVDAVDQGLVQIKDQCLLMRSLWESHTSVVEILLTGLTYIFHIL